MKVESHSKLVMANMCVAQKEKPTHQIQKLWKKCKSLYRQKRYYKVHNLMIIFKIISMQGPGPNLGPELDPKLNLDPQPIRYPLPNVPQKWGQ